MNRVEAGPSSTCRVMICRSEHGVRAALWWIDELGALRYVEMDPSVIRNAGLGGGDPATTMQLILSSASIPSTTD